jgi:hypothetical protein
LFLGTIAFTARELALDLEVFASRAPILAADLKETPITRFHAGQTANQPLKNIGLLLNRDRKI